MGRKKHQNFNKLSSLKRKSAHLEPRKTFLIACEGLCTEPNYINTLVKQQKELRKIADGTRVIIANHQHTNPDGVVKDLLATPGCRDFDEKWILIDRDEIEISGKGVGGHKKEDFETALALAKKNRISVACSNPCFELWIVLHFEFLQTAITRKDVQEKARQKINSLLPKEKQFKKVDDMKAYKDLYLLLSDKTDIARMHAEKLSENEEKKINPSTGVYKLLESLLVEGNKGEIR